MILNVENKVKVDNYEAQQIDTEQLISRLAYLEQQLILKEDQVNADKIKQLMHKVYSNHYIIGFTGHYSAGKSSLINHLFADDVLPTSPIPTSANIVKVTSGEPLATVTFKDGRRYEFLPPYNMDVIKNFCLDGNAVDLVEIQHPSNKIPPNVSIMDTPGIDSTDDAHRLATESVLHLADVLFFVMDYNHVQSELNLNFTKEVTSRKIKLFLVINQIDKHRDQELSFEKFKEGVMEAFSNWEVYPEEIFFTSLRANSNPNNQLSGLKDRINTLYYEKEQYINKNAVTAAHYIIEDHIIWLKEAQQSNLEEDLELYTSLSTDEIERITSTYQDITNELNQLEKAPIQLTDQLNENMQKILHNSTLMPYETRQLAHQFLESTQPKFKIGFIFSEKKTEEERARRLNNLYSDLKAKISSQIDWHIKSLLLELINSFNLRDGKLIQSIYDMEISIGIDLLQRAVKKDALLNGDYLLNYTKEVSESIKQIFRSAALTKLEEIKNTLMEQTRSKIQNLSERIDYFNNQLQAIDKIDKFNNNIYGQKQTLLQVLAGEVEQALLLEARQQADFTQISKITHTIESDMSLVVQKISDEAVDDAHLKIPPQVENEVKAVTTYNLSQQLNTAAAKLRSAAEILSDMIGFDVDAKEMIQKAERLEENRFTVSLFGAFSAGKSSFANALMGEELLPTSPNPTTAAITKIMPPTSDFAHRTIRVKVKTKQDILNDLVQSLSVFDIHVNNLEDSLLEIASISHEDLNIKAKPHFSFIKAFEKGYTQFSNLFGDIIDGDISQLEPFVAQEEKAAFIEWIEIYYDNPLTKQGITLVDTPGADSIHSRHTGVAFEYIKNADTIIYVTYYNHAFSQADQLFLSQLGRVKEAFEMDKMFFIVNAIDLAKSKEEVSLVIKHVEQNLLASSVRMSRIYPVSSKVALDEKLEMNKSKSNSDSKFMSSGFQKFERDFIQFTLSELVDVATNAAMLDIHRAQQKLLGYLTASKDGEENRKKRLILVNELHQQVITRLEQLELYSYECAIEQEIDELIYYVKQRLNLRLRDTFKISFSPAVLRKDVHDIKKELRLALEEWLKALQVELLQEMRATVVRVEKILNRLYLTLNSKAIEEVQLLDHSVVIGQHTMAVLLTPNIEVEQLLLKAEPFLPHLSLFKSQKQFFEQGGNQIMLDELISQLQEPLTATLEQLTKQFTQYYLQLLHELYNELNIHMRRQVDQYYSGEVAALSMKIDLATLQNQYNKIQHLTNGVG